MPDSSTATLIGAYLEEARAPMFLSGFFQSPPRNFHTTEGIHLDVQRDDESVAVVIQDVTTGRRHNKSTRYTSKEFTPPIFHEEGLVDAYTLLKRRPNHAPHDAVDYAATATEEAFAIGRKLERKIGRAVELMASQVLQSGKLTLKDESGAALYELDFQAKDTHFPDAATPWGDVGDDKLADLESLAKKLRQHGFHRPARLIFGDRAFGRFVDDDTVQKRLDARNMMVGQVAPEVRGEGATFQGFVWIGHYRFEMWTYDASYRDPETGEHPTYVDQDNVIMMSEGARLDLTFGAIPIIRRPSERAMPFLPPRISSPERGLDLTTNSWFSDDGSKLHVSFGTRPLTIPTAVDTFGCLNTAGLDS